MTGIQYNHYSDYLILYGLNIAAIEPNNNDGSNELVQKRRALVIKIASQQVINLHTYMILIYSIITVYAQAINLHALSFNFQTNVIFSVLKIIASTEKVHKIQERWKVGEENFNSAALCVEQGRRNCVMKQIHAMAIKRMFLISLKRKYAALCVIIM